MLTRCKINEKQSFQTEKLSHSDLDERALDALKEFPVEGALAVLKQFLESNLVRTSQHMSNLKCLIVRSTSPTSLPTFVGWWKPTARKQEREPPRAPMGQQATRAIRARMRRRSRPSWTGPATAWTWRPARGSMEGHRQAGTEPPLATAVRWVKLLRSVSVRRAQCFLFSPPGVLWKDSQRHLWGRINSPFREMW